MMILKVMRILKVSENFKYVLKEFCMKESHGKLYYLWIQKDQITAKTMTLKCGTVVVWDVVFSGHLIGVIGSWHL